MFKTAGFAFAVCAIGILTIAWSQTKAAAARAPVRRDDLPQAPDGRP